MSASRSGLDEERTPDASSLIGDTAVSHLIVSTLGICAFLLVLRICAPICFCCSRAAKRGGGARASRRDKRVVPKNAETPIASLSPGPREPDSRDSQRRWLAAQESGLSGDGYADDDTARASRV